MSIKNINVNNDNFLIDIFFSLADFIVRKNPELNLTVRALKGKAPKEEYNKGIFYKSGQLLMFLYVFSVNNLNKSDIHYDNETFYLDLCKDNFSEYGFCNIDSKSISCDIIQKSVYNKQYFPDDINLYSINLEEHFDDFIKGFKITYKTFLKEKINILELFEDMPLKNKCFNLIKEIKLLNPIDMEMQIQLIKLKMKRNLKKNPLLEKIKYLKINNEEFIDLSINFLDFLIQNSIIGISSTGSIEMTWIKHEDNKIIPIGPERIYIAIYFSYISKITENEYYIHSAYNTIAPLLNPEYSDYKKIKSDEEIQKSIYLLNTYINYPGLDFIIKNNSNLFNLVSDKYKENCINNNQQLVSQCIRNNSIDTFDSIILP